MEIESLLRDKFPQKDGGVKVLLWERYRRVDQILQNEILKTRILKSNKWMRLCYSVNIKKLQNGV